MTTAGAPPPAGPFVYPLRYPVKVIGLAAADFAGHVVALVERAAGARAEEAPEVRSSGGGKYHSVTVVVTLESEERRLAIYAALRVDPRVVFAL
jgi:putative lipoic acid-binding regulatory protein